MKYTLSLDWLSFWCQAQVFNSWEPFQIEFKPYGTSVFSSVADLVLDNEVCFTLAFNPRSKLFDEHTMQVKVNNRRLYTGQWLRDWALLQEVVRFHEIKINRLDLAADFNTFKNGLTAKRLINLFLTCDFIKTGRGKFYVIGEQKKYIDAQYLRFGKGDSDVSAYLYNKSKELDQVKDKPYIRAAWTGAGLDTSKDIWRLEFSLKSQALKIYQTNTGEAMNVTSDLITNRKFLLDLYLSMQSKYFSFQLKENQKNKSRWKRVDLFGTEFEVYDIVRCPDNSDSSVRNKIFLKNLMLLDKEMRTLKQSYKFVLEELAEDYAREFNIQHKLAQFRQNNSHFQ